jgi:hypothetical protein
LLKQVFFKINYRVKINRSQLLKMRVKTMEMMTDPTYKNAQNQALE